MQLIENLRQAFTSLAANKMRALLTMLGIIIGISSVIMITTIGTSIQKTLMNTFNQLGNANYFYVQLYRTTYDGSFSDSDYFTREMVDELMETYGDHFYPDLSDGFGQATLLNTEGETFSISLNGQLSQPEMLDHQRGRAVSFQDNKELKHTAYVSDLFVRQYCKDGSDPIGQTIDVTMENGITVDLTIVGVYELYSGFDRMYPPGTKEMEKTSPVIVPLDTMAALTHQENTSTTWLDIRRNTDYDVNQLEQELHDFFDEKYAENPNYEVYIENAQSELKLINTVISIITIAISVIAAISLIVGGVGVMNIMLVSITERTREIGVRKALGAQNSAIRMQFVVEAILICMIGGVIGILIGIAGGMLIGWIATALVQQYYSDYADFIAITVQPSIPAILIAVLFSMLTGVFFGYYPANKAAKMNPIDALRYD